MDSRRSGSSLSNSYFLSSTSNSSNGLFEDCSVNLTEILREFKSILSLSDDFEESEVIKRNRRSAIVAGGHLNYDQFDKLDNRQIRDQQSLSNIGNIVNRSSLSGISFRMDKIENSICSGKDFNFMSSSESELGIIVDKNFKSNESTENQLFTTRFSLGDFKSVNYEEDKFSGLEYKQNSYNTPDIVVTQVSENNLIDDDDDGLSRSKFTHLLRAPSTTSNFFIRKNTRKYFLSPGKSATKFNRGKSGDFILSNKSSYFENSENSQNEEEKFYEILNKMSNYCLEDVSNPEWPVGVLTPEKSTDQHSCQVLNHLAEDSFSHFKSLEKSPNAEKFHKIVKNLSPFSLESIKIPEWPSFNETYEENERQQFFNTSTPYKNKPPLPQFFGSHLSPVSREQIVINLDQKFDFGVSAKNYFSRRKGLRYFSTPQ